MATYKIVRYYQKESVENEVIETGLTLEEEAQEHCNDPEASWTTCSLRANKLLTEKYGPWFDGYTEE